mmetsp:Transcript_3673/g.7868  ORF Transcript_3673/g.7868 Transcript_3673/m.7868 type:complete len:208 (-) Transcript_3673:36-659(-)
MSIFCTETGIEIRKQLRRELVLPPPEKVVRFGNDPFPIPSFRTPDLRSYSLNKQNCLGVTEEYVGRGVPTAVRKPPKEDYKFTISPMLPAKSYSVSPAHSDRGLRIGRLAELHEQNMKKRTEFLAKLRTRAFPAQDYYIKKQIDALVASHFKQGSSLLKPTRMEERKKERIERRLRHKFEQGWEGRQMKEFLDRNVKSEKKMLNPKS